VAGFFMKIILTITVAFFLLTPISAQQFFRVKTDFSIKQKNADNTNSLTMGTAYYDKTTKRLTYQISFPEKEVWVFKDTLMYVFKNGKFFTKKRSIMIPEFTIFHLALSNNLADYGLKNTAFKVEKIEKDKGMVITTYKPSGKMAMGIGKIMLSSIDKKLNGVIFYSPKNEMSSKVFYKNYINVKGLSFPTTVTQFTYIKGENISQTTYKNVRVDQMGDEEFYNYNIKGF
jgi:hypothetical protein